MEENKSSIGSIIGTIIIIALIILGGLYFWGKKIENSRNAQELTSEDVMTDEEIAAESDSIKQTNSSDSIQSIETDLSATNIDNIDAELNSQAELQ
ncbi:MAG: hypothetical protein WC095_00725 [Candidatus Paceibacterota bacterium]